MLILPHCPYYPRYSCRRLSGSKEKRFRPTQHGLSNNMLSTHLAGPGPSWYVRFTDYLIIVPTEGRS